MMSDPNHDPEAAPSDLLEDLPESLPELPSAPESEPRQPRTVLDILPSVLALLSAISAGAAIYLAARHSNETTSVIVHRVEVVERAATDVTGIRDWNQDETIADAVLGIRQSPALSLSAREVRELRELAHDPHCGCGTTVVPESGGDASIPQEGCIQRVGPAMTEWRGRGDEIINALARRTSAIEQVLQCRSAPPPTIDDENGDEHDGDDHSDMPN